MKPHAWEEFNQYFWTGYNGDDGDGPIHIIWTDKLGVYKTKTKVVEFKLETRGTMDKYEGYKVRIIHKTNGKLSSHFFKFDDYLDERKDKRQHDYPHGDRSGGFYVHHNSQAKFRKELEVWWYIAVPTFDAIAGMQSAITSWLESYL
ncbi:MAG: hypothetical protein KAR08_06795 [Candidatus Heimdallarchaeota archaeon]|nr:hypothetical protein [Candidatus Heimdallarchaeota archaeon]MCK5615385.1 hypothetical protein [Candidatus Pacearchaeota archaeon]